MSRATSSRLIALELARFARVANLNLERLTRSPRAANRRHGGAASLRRCLSFPSSARWRCRQLRPPVHCSFPGPAGAHAPQTGSRAECRCSTDDDVQPARQGARQRPECVAGDRRGVEAAQPTEPAARDIHRQSVTDRGSCAFAAHGAEPAAAHTATGRIDRARRQSQTRCASRDSCPECVAIGQRDAAADSPTISAPPATRCFVGCTDSDSVAVTQDNAIVVTVSECEQQARFVAVAEQQSAPALPALTTRNQRAKATASTFNSVLCGVSKIFFRTVLTVVAHLSALHR